jgi:hypothetical protein
MTLFDIFTLPNRQKLVEFGIEIGHLYTDKGFPVDMALDRLPNLSKLEKLAVLTGLCNWLIDHKRNSGATDKAIDRQRKLNNKMVDDFIKTGETGVY